jgi:hypothetical protein
MDIDDFGDMGDLDLGPLWLRRLAWDALPCEMVEDVQKALGLVPVGDEQQIEKDHTASHHRIALVDHLVPAVEYLSPYLSQVLTKAIVMQLGDDVKGQVTPEVESKLSIQNSEIIRSASLTIIAQFLSTGVLDYVNDGGES